MQKLTREELVQEGKVSYRTQGNDILFNLSELKENYPDLKIECHDTDVVSVFVEPKEDDEVGHNVDFIKLDDIIYSQVVEGTEEAPAPEKPAKNAKKKK